MPAPNDDSLLVAEWAEELACHCKRSVEDIKAQGLSAYDFRYDVEIVYGETRLYFHYALCVVNKKKGLLGVFTEHQGYHVFPTYNATVYTVAKNWVYSWDEEAQE